MSISPWETPATVSVKEAYLHQLQADAGRWRYVLQKSYSRASDDGGWEWIIQVKYKKYLLLDEAIDRLIAEQREGKQ